MWSNLIQWLLILVLISACARPTPSPTPTPALSGRITFAGSTTLQPLAAKLGEAFKAKYPAIELDIAAGGSRVGIEAAQQGTADIGMVSRALKPEEAEGIQVHIIAWDVLAIVVHPSNPINDLSFEQLQAIYRGEITNWKAVGGPDAPITVVVRDKNSGTRGAFDEIVLGGKEVTLPTQVSAQTAGDVAYRVENDPHAIGYLGYGNIETALKVLTLNGASPTPEHVLNQTYRLVRPLAFLTHPLTQPQGLAFVEFALSAEGQAMVKAYGWVPVNLPQGGQ